MSATPNESTDFADLSLAERLYAEWQAGKPKSAIERDEWDDGKAHGRRFDRFISQTLGLSTVKRSKLSDRLEDLEKQVRSLGAVPVGSNPSDWEVQLAHARRSCLEGLRLWNDPTADFRSSGFALFLVTAWNALAIAVLQSRGDEWRKLDEDSNPLVFDGVEQSMDTKELVRLAFPDGALAGLRANVGIWVDLRNAVAHRHLPALDFSVIPHAQASLVNFENSIVGQFGSSFALAHRLSVPLQLSGFRDPGVLASRKKLQAALPLDVQNILARPELENPTLATDETFLLRVAFIPFIPASSRSPDAVAYFVKPGEVPGSLAEPLEEFLIMPKGYTSRPNIRATDVVHRVQEQIPFRFNTTQHAEAGRRLGARPEAGEDEATVDIRLAEWISALKRHLYTELWVKMLVEKLSTAEGFRESTGREPQPKEPDIDMQPEQNGSV